MEEECGSEQQELLAKQKVKLQKYEIEANLPDALLQSVRDFIHKLIILTQTIYCKGFDFDIWALY